WALSRLMSYRIPLPTDGQRSLDIVEPNSTAVQRSLRRNGLAAYEPPTVATLLALFEDQPDGFGFFDVGANMGLYALLCASLFEPEVVDAFEPTPSTSQVARTIVKKNGLDVTVAEIALSDSNGTVTLHLSDKSDASNSLVEGFKTSSAGIDVERTRLDDYVQRTGHRPQVMKIDVETHEPEVLAGADETIRRERPFIVIEVLNRHGRDHGLEITEAMAPYAYSYYELSDPADWHPRSEVTGALGTPHHDWLLAPAPLDDQFAARCEVWRDRLARCGPERNSRVPVRRSVMAAARRGGVREVVAAGGRYIEVIRRGKPG
ncbi:MAG: FkbM family methyltransferase, partial [Acidimicrobiia bacterium]|nr:FkbM family methyltransferase [Acidimicrobiia bacterium]